MKKILALFLCLCMVFSSLVGCSKSQTENEGNTEGKEVTKDESDKVKKEDDDNDEIVKIVWQYPTAGELGPGFQDVEDALNEMLEKDIGVHVTLEPCSLDKSQQEASLAISSGEQVDIINTAFTGVGSIVDSELIIALDDLLASYGEDITEQCNVAAIDGCRYDGKLYGIPMAYTVFNAYGYAIRKDLCEKYDITIDPNKVYTLDELEKIFATVKAGEGENFFCTIPWNGTDDPLNGSYIAYDKIGGGLSSGVLMLNRSFEDLTVFNLFETEEYKDYVNMMYDWAKKGYIAPDAAITTEQPGSLLATGNYLGEMFWANPDSAASLSSTGYDYDMIRLVDYFIANNGGQATMWNISSSCKHPEKAMQTLNYIYKNKEATWLLQFGIEGESYEIVEQNDEGTQIKYTSDDVNALPYYQLFGIYGNRFDWPVVYPTEIGMSKILKDTQAMIPKSRYSPALGYSFVQSSVSAEIAAINTVIAQYMSTFNAGALDPEQALPEFIAALKAAGIDKVISENQKQLDEWAANNK